jgi:hypothetical protein
MKKIQKQGYMEISIRFLNDMLNYVGIKIP